MDESKFYKEKIDRTRNIVHGSFLENLDSIIQYGICPPSMLPDEARPKRFFGGTNKDDAYCGTYANYISTFVNHDWNNYCLVDRKVWSPFFHYFIVAEHNDWGTGRKSQDKPWYIHSVELTLYNQKITKNQFIGLVIPTDDDIAELIEEEEEKGQKVFIAGNEIMNSRYISDMLVELMTLRQFHIPIFDFNGICIYHPKTESK